MDSDIASLTTIRFTLAKGRMVELSVEDVEDFIASLWETKGKEPEKDAEGNPLKGPDGEQKTREEIEAGKINIADMHCDAVYDLVMLATGSESLANSYRVSAIKRQTWKPR